MAERIEAYINPDVLAWARGSIGYDLEVAAKKIATSSDRLRKWEDGELRPTFNQLRKVANVYKRPIPFFYLAKPPEDIEKLKDFRSFPDTDTEVASPKLRLEMRRTLFRRENALELLDELGMDIPSIELSTSLRSSPETIAVQVSSILDLSRDGWKNDYDALNAWKLAVEELGVLVFQASGINIQEMRGFSVNKKPLPIIVINSKDTVRGRIFSILHEFTHLILEDGGLCNLLEDHGSDSHEKRVEVFCNYVAGAVMVPSEELKNDPEYLYLTSSLEWDDLALDNLANRYRASREVVLRRMLILGGVSEELYKNKRKEYIDQFKTRPKTPGFATVHGRTIATLGRQYVNLVYSAYSQNKINISQVSDYLGVKTMHFNRIWGAL